jgi:hypothetical protein
MTYRPEQQTTTRAPLTDPGATLHKDRGWRQRNGSPVPAPECLPPHLRVSVRDFCALVEQMMGVGD